MTYIAIITNLPKNGHPNHKTRLHIEKPDGTTLTHPTPIPHDPRHHNPDESINLIIQNLGYTPDLNASGWKKLHRQPDTYMHHLKKLPTP